MQHGDSRTILHFQIEVTDVEVGREQRLQRAPIETSGPRTFRIIAANLSARGFDRQRTNAIAAPANNFCETETKDHLLGVEIDLSRGARNVRDANAIDQNRPQKRRADFAELNLQLLSMRLPTEPETKPIGNRKRSEHNSTERHDQ